MTQSVKLLGKMLSFSNLVLKSNDLNQIEADLEKRIGKQKAMGIPVVVDTEHELDIDALFTILRKLGLQPIGLIDGVLTKVAKEKNIAVFPRGKALEKIDPKPDQGNTVVYERMLRSGQSISNNEGDLVIMNDVNDGAEAIASGSLHVYGKAFGRIVAGATGDPKASIFCQKLSASLISLAGVYCTRDDIPKDIIGQAVHITFDTEKGLVFNLMNPEVV